MRLNPRIANSCQVLRLMTAVFALMLACAVQASAQSIDRDLSGTYTGAAEVEIDAEGHATGCKRRNRRRMRRVFVVNWTTDNASQRRQRQDKVLFQ